MDTVFERVNRHFDEGLAELKAASPLTRKEKAAKLASQIDILTRTAQGLEHLYRHCLELEEAGIFDETPWQDANKQVPSLVKGTLLAGHPSSTFEILSELRILAYASGESGSQNVKAEDARGFLEEVVVHNLDFALDELNEETRSKLTPQERKKVVQHFKFLLEKADLSGIKGKLGVEIDMVCAQRPVVTRAVRDLIRTVYYKMDLDGRQDADLKLIYYINAIYAPGSLAEAHPDLDDYATALASSEIKALEKEANHIGAYLHDTGLTNPYLAVFLRFALEKQPDLVPMLLRLNRRGEAEWRKYREYVSNLASEVFDGENFLGIYGLKRMLERGLFSRRPVRSGITNLKLINIHPAVERRIKKSVSKPSEHVTAKAHLLGALIGLLGQPLGIGQGNNATCQSARGISMWAQHAPAKLINMITTVATANNLIMRFENQDLESLKLGKGLVDKLDHALDAVSVILVPHLDKVYNEMMRRAAGRGEDPHKWVNPAMYGHWIPLGFASAYSYLTNAVQDFDGFVRLFYSTVHPLHNGGREMVYPIPVGIFITSSRAELLGFHAVSLLRVAKDESSDEYRCYFLNPNNEGRQDWGQGIRPKVYGHGEKHGESSLPFDQFVARTYAYHYNTLHQRDEMNKVPTKPVKHIISLARDSWGKGYHWSNIKKSW
jgi:hypothetical protein